MNDFKTFHDSTPQAAKNLHSSASSLAISIDLDAMLEYDERNRHNINPFDSARSSTSFQSSGSPAFPTGLPPPPRRNGKGGSRSSSLRDLSSVGSGSTRSPDATDPLFPFLVPAAPELAVSNPFINAVPQLTRDVEQNAQNQSTVYSPPAPGVPSNFQASDSGVDPLETDHGHDLFISFRSRKTPTSTAYSMPRMEKVVGKTKGMSGQSDPQQNSKKEESSAALVSRFKFPEDGSTKLSADTHIESQKESDETYLTLLLAGLSRPADELTALAESRKSSQDQAYSSELTHSPLANSPSHPVAYGSDSQYHQISGHNDPYGNNISSTSSSSSRKSSIESTASSPVFATSFDRSPVASLIDVSRPTLYMLDQPGVVLRSSGGSPSSSSRSAVHPAMLPSAKPPLPTTPKPNFRRSTSANPLLNNRSRRASPNPISHFVRQASPITVDESLSPMPPTTNQLDPQERADLVKKSRKLAQMFGTTPGATVLSQKHDEFPGNTSLPYLQPSKPAKHHGATGPALDDKDLRSSWLIPGGIQHLASSRRHSVPFSPDVLHDDISEGYIMVSNTGTRIGAASDLASNRASTGKVLDSPSSSMDLSHEGNPISAILSTYPGHRRLGLQHSPSTPSLTSTIANQEEVDRKRKRDQLAKLHRFLGSRVPVNLVLGLDRGDASLPPVILRGGSKPDPTPKAAEPRKLWSTRRRSSSADMYPRPSQSLDRLKEDLSDEEKAINVRRAQKMEKVFGVLPPQALYHTRCSPSPTHPSNTSPASPSFGRWTAPPSPISSQVFERNPNQSSYKAKSRKHERPGTPESMQQLLPGRSRDSFYFDSQHLAVPNVYTHYQHSLHSLNDIIDRDDRASLVELHQYLQGEIPDPPFQEFGQIALGSLNIGRRRSLPSTTSTTESNAPTVKPEPTDFQLRRRRAAKLTQFFGVDYKQIIHDVLESIEKGVEEERKTGTLQPEEVEVLLQKVHTLKTKRSAIL